jgi:hypothetical protein
MTTKLPPHLTPTPEPLPHEERPLPNEARQPAVENADAAEIEEGEEHEPDRYDELWDPNIDTRPERIRKTRARREFRPKGGAPGRGRKREGL